MKQFISLILFCLIGGFMFFVLSGQSEFDSTHSLTLKQELTPLSFYVILADIWLFILLGLGIYKWWVKSSLENKTKRDPLRVEFINNSVHVVIEYLLIVFLFLSPSIFELTETSSTIIYILGGIFLFLVVFTNFKLGIIKLIPIVTHGIIELIIAVFLIISPFTFGFQHITTDKNYFMFLGLGIYIFNLLSYYHRDEKP